MEIVQSLVSPIRWLNIAERVAGQILGLICMG